MIQSLHKFLFFLLFFSGSLFADAGVTFGNSGPSVWKLLLSLVFVVALVPIVLFGLKKLQGLQHKYGKTPIQIVSVQPLGTKEKLVVVEVEQQRLLLGVTGQNIALLKTLSDKNIEFSEYLDSNRVDQTAKTSGAAE
ncbi:flagellar biosynthetic protein FliO [Marinomonas agarivorans]|nr:flagellar biosynthetic protein FliO [Marinomonas agarivorans]